MTTPIYNPRLAAYAQDALSILEQSLRLCQEDHPEFYRVAAVQLRLLLCDTTRRHNELVDIALLPRLNICLELAALSREGEFDTAQLLGLPDWLNQPLACSEKTLTIRQLIRRVSDQDGGAHVDSRSGAVDLPTADAAYWVEKIGTAILQACSQFPQLRKS